MKWRIFHFYTLLTGHTKIVELLIKNGANVNASDEFNSTPLHYIRDKDIAIAEMLINAGADPQIKNMFNHTSSHNVHNKYSKII